MTLHPARCATAALLALLACAAPAAANTITSNNWSGYAAHGAGVKFRHVSATWRQPAAICSTGSETYSAFWVGIGGYSLRSDAMEQLGTELDCNADGTQTLSAWYELLPAPSRAIRITIAGGDLITAGVTISGDRVTLTLHDTTRQETFVRAITDHTIDASSAEWIAEAPSDCSSATSCEALPLTDFGAVQFANASAATTSRRAASISSPLWDSTKILLGYAAQGATFVAKTSTANATPSALTGGGRAFRVDYSGASATGTGTATGSGSGGGSGGPGGGGFPGGPGGPPAPGGR